MSRAAAHELDVIGLVPAEVRPLLRSLLERGAGSG